MRERSTADIEGYFGVHFVRQDLEVRHGVICAVNTCESTIIGESRGMSADPFLYPQEPSSPWRSRRQLLRPLEAGRS